MLVVDKRGFYLLAGSSRQFITMFILAYWFLLSPQLAVVVALNDLLTVLCVLVRGEPTRNSTLMLPCKRAIKYHEMFRGPVCGVFFFG